MVIRGLAGAAILLCSSGALAQQLTVIGHGAESLGAQAIMAGDYAGAEQQIRAADVSKFDPARQINLGVVLAKTGRAAEAEKLFKRVLVEDPVDLTTVNGQTISSHEVADRALEYFRARRLALK